VVKHQGKGIEYETNRKNEERKGSAAQWQRRNKNFMSWLTVSQGRT